MTNIQEWIGGNPEDEDTDALLGATGLPSLGQVNMRRAGLLIPPPIPGDEGQTKPSSPGGPIGLMTKQVLGASEPDSVLDSNSPNAHPKPAGDPRFSWQTAPAAPSQDDELAAAYKKSQLRGGLGALGANLSAAAGMISGHEVANPAAHEAMATANEPVQLLLKKKQLEAEQKKAEMEQYNAETRRMVEEAQNKRWDAYSARQQAQIDALNNKNKPSEVEPKLITGPSGEKVWFDPITRKFSGVRPPSRPGAGKGGPGSPTAGMDDSVLNSYADEMASGKPIELPRGKEGFAARIAIRQRAIQRHPDWNPALAGAGYKSDTQSLSHMTQQADSINSFTSTFDKNSEILKNAVAELDSSDTPIINKGYRVWQKASGSPALTKFQNALNTVRSELGKINSGATGAGGAPISVLQEMEHGLPDNATPAQVLAALDVYRQDSENRRSAMQEQIDKIKGRMGGGGGSSALPAGAKAQYSPSRNQTRITYPDGRVEVRNGKL